MNNKYLEKGLRRVKSITQSYNGVKNLDDKIEKVTRLTQRRKVDSLEINKFPEYPQYIGYYFRKAYKQVIIEFH